MHLSALSTKGIGSLALLFLLLLGIPATASISGTASTEATVVGWGVGPFGDGISRSSISDAQLTPMALPSVGYVSKIAAGSSGALTLGIDNSMYGWGYIKNAVPSTPDSIALKPWNIRHLTERFISMDVGDSSLFFLEVGNSIGRANRCKFPWTECQGTVYDVTAIAAGSEHSLAIKTDSTLVAWGKNYIGLLGDGTLIDKTSPVAVSNLTGIIAIAASSYNSVALKSDSTVWTWGVQGLGYTGFSTVPRQVGIANVVAIATGFAWSTLALKSDGTVWRWGHIISGYEVVTPVQVKDLTNVVAISAGRTHAVALKSDGTVWAWGGNSFGQLGDGTQTDRDTPVQVPGLSHVLGIAAGGAFTFVMVATPVVKAISSTEGPIAGGSTITIQGKNFTEATGVKFGDVEASFTIVSDNQITATVPAQSSCGRVHVTVSFNQVTSIPSSADEYTYGPQTISFPDLPVKTLGDADFSVIATASSNLAMRYTSSNPFVATVDSITGQVHILGAGETTITATQPGDNSYLPNHAIRVLRVLTPPVNLVAWGANKNGQLGNGSMINPSTPVAVRSLSNVVSMVTGYQNAIALDHEGTFWSWGASYQLGDSTVTRISTPKTVNGLSDVASLAVGGDFTVALKNNGTVSAWGGNSSLQLGNSILAKSGTPLAVDGLQNIVSIAAGHSHTVALDKDGMVWALGNNSSGQLGLGWDAGSYNRNIPVMVPGLDQAVSIAAGPLHTVALKSDGTVWAWGDNTSGQLGNSTTTSTNYPVAVSNLSNVVSISTQGNFTVALRSDSTVWAWGDNTSGQLGDGTTTNQSSPVQVSGLTHVISVSAGQNHVVALKDDGSTWAWGDNTYGQLGDGTTTNRTSPVQVGGLGLVYSIFAGANFSIAQAPMPVVRALSPSMGPLAGGSQVTLSGTYFRNATSVKFGSLDASAFTVLSDSQITATVPAVASPTVVHVIVTGSGNTSLPSPADQYTYGGQVIDFANLPAKSVGDADFSAGATASSGLALSYSSSNPLVATVNQTTGLIHIIAYGETSIMASQAGDASHLPVQMIRVLRVQKVATAMAWGNNAESQLGESAVSASSTPIAVKNMVDGVSIVAGESHVVALKKDGTVWAWGSNAFGQSGNNKVSIHRTPEMVEGLTNVVAVGAGKEHSVALKGDGSVWVWGNNIPGLLGGDSTVIRTSPAMVRGLEQIVAVAAGKFHTAALKSDGTVWTWGNNNAGQLGNSFAAGSDTSLCTPDAVNGLDHVMAIAAGANHTVALKSDGTVWTWGANGAGQLGEGSTINRNTAAQVNGLSNVVSISAKGDFTMALKSDGTVWTWGANGAGQLGDGTTTSRSTPVAVSGLSGVVSISAGSNHSAALKNGGNLLTWGDNTYGQLGNGTSTNSSTPVMVSSINTVLSMAMGLNFTVALASIPRITVVSPAMGPLAGGGFVTIHGSNFQNATAVKFGVVDAIAYTVDSDIQITATVPAAATPSMVDVTVTADGYTSFTGLADQYTYGSQSITFEEIPAKSVGDADFYAKASASSGLAVSYTSSNPLVATVDGSTGLIHIVANGETSIMASQAGDASNIAVQMIRVLRVQKEASVVAWGSNISGQLGDGTLTNSTTPVPAKGLGLVVSIDQCNSNTMALKSNGTVWTWGDNSYGQLGNASLTSSSIPVQVAGLTNVVAISCGFNYSVALKSDGTLWAWGDNRYGELGDGTFTDRPTPVKVQGLDHVVAIAKAGVFPSTIALKSDGTVWTWGWNNLGQLGDGTTTDRNYPAQVNGLDHVVGIIAGSGHTMALKSDGLVWAWGKNTQGQLGDGTKTTRSTPAQVSNLNHVVAISTSGYASFALRDDNTVWGWGAKANSAVPVAVSGWDNVHAITSGNFVLKNDGTVWTKTSATETTTTKISGLNNVQSLAAYSTYNAVALVLQPVVATLSSSEGPVAGGSTVTITGENFSGATSVKFGNMEAAYTVDSDKQITATVPAALVPGVVHVSVTANFITSDTTSADRYTYGPQTLVFEALTEKVYGDADFDLTAKASSGLAVNYASSNPAVASVEKGLVHIVGAGSTTITATQSGSSQYIAVAASQVLTVKPKMLSVAKAVAQNKEYDGTTLATILGASIPDVISGDDVILKLGTATFDTKDTGTAKPVAVTGSTLGGNAAANYTLLEVSGLSANISPRTVTVTASDATITLGDALPKLVYKVSGLLDGDKLSGALTCKTPAAAGSYAIAQGTLSADANYALVFHGGTLTVLDATSLLSPSGFEVLYQIRGDILSASGALGRVEIYNLDGSRVLSLMVNAAGNYRLGLLPGVYSLRVAGRNQMVVLPK